MGVHKFLLFSNFLPLLATNYNFVMKLLVFNDIMSKPPCSRMLDESQTGGKTTNGTSVATSSKSFERGVR